ncbi:hypothetical protein [Flammeovirga sp. SubArs3]|uniref:hypothetical protein n=1 Tax=Flammeovirga sp. SubArs3 TaxID=2995316 RepID=UPI00248CF15F|nr:hypothetical protein [Flammeovirga sp. SubArs3]
MESSKQTENATITSFDWDQWKVDMLSSNFDQSRSTEELLLVKENLSPTVKAAAQQCVTDSNNDFQSEIKNQHQLILQSLTPSKPKDGNTSGVNWNAWKKKTLKQLDQASDKSNEKTVDAIAEKGKSLPPQEQESFAEVMGHALLSNIDEVFNDIRDGIVEAADKIAEGVEDAGKAIGNWAEGAAKSVGNFFSSIF